MPSHVHLGLPVIITPRFGVSELILVEVDGLPRSFSLGGGGVFSVLSSLPLRRRPLVVVFGVVFLARSQLHEL